MTADWADSLLAGLLAQIHPRIFFVCAVFFFCSQDTFFPWVSWSFSFSYCMSTFVWHTWWSFYQWTHYSVIIHTTTLHPKNIKYDWHQPGHPTQRWVHWTSTWQWHDDPPTASESMRVHSDPTAKSVLLLFGEHLAFSLTMALTSLTFNFQSIRLVKHACRHKLV